MQMPMDSHLCMQNNNIDRDRNLKKNRNCPNLPASVGGFGHGWGAFGHN